VDFASPAGRTYFSHGRTGALSFYAMQTPSI
jgi:hypothetical protein